MLPTRVMPTEDAVLLFDAGAATVRFTTAWKPSQQTNSQQVQGGRVSQEDRHVVLLPHQFPPTKSTDKFALFATYDGQYALHPFPMLQGHG